MLQVQQVPLFIDLTDSLTHSQPEISSEANNIRKPPQVRSISEFNTRLFNFEAPALRSLNQQHQLDNHLDFEFPVHAHKDFVSLHSLGFKGKDNIDLFKHFLRMYVKNKAAINQNKKDRKIKNQMKSLSPPISPKGQPKLFAASVQHPPVQSVQLEIPQQKQQQQQQRKQSLTSQQQGDLDATKPLQQLLSRSSHFVAQFKKGNSIVQDRLQLQQHILQQGITDMLYYEGILDQMQQSKNNLQVNGISLLKEIQRKLNVVNLDTSIIPDAETAGNYDRKHEIEDIFIGQIVDRLNKYGPSILSVADLSDFKLIIKGRSLQLAALNDQLRNRLVDIKRNVMHSLETNANNTSTNAQMTTETKFGVVFPWNEPLEKQYHQYPLLPDKTNKGVKANYKIKQYNETSVSSVNQTNDRHHLSSSLLTTDQTYSVMSRIESIRLSPISKKKRKQTSRTLLLQSFDGAKSSAVDLSSVDFRSISVQEQAIEEETDEMVAKEIASIRKGFDIDEGIRRIEEAILRRNRSVQVTLEDDDEEEEIAVADEVDEEQEVELIQEVDTNRVEESQFTEQQSQQSQQQQNSTESMQQEIGQSAQSQVVTEVEGGVVVQQEKKKRRKKKKKAVVAASDENVVPSPADVIEIPRSKDALDLLIDIASETGRLDALMNLILEKGGKDRELIIKEWAIRLQELVREEAFQDRLRQKCKIDVVKLKITTKQQKKEMREKQKKELRKQQVMQEKLLLQQQTRQYLDQSVIAGAGTSTAEEMKTLNLIQSSNNSLMQGRGHESELSQDVEDDDDDDDSFLYNYLASQKGSGFVASNDAIFSLSNSRKVINSDRRVVVNKSKEVNGANSSNNNSKQLDFIKETLPISKSSGGLLAHLQRQNQAVEKLNMKKVTRLPLAEVQAAAIAALTAGASTGLAEQTEQQQTTGRKSQTTIGNQQSQSRRQISVKKDEQAQRRSLMAQYLGDESLDEINQKVYSLEDEIEVREKLRAREIEEQAKINVAAKKMNIKSMYEEIDPNLLEFQELVHKHKKSNQAQFTKSPTKVRNKSRSPPKRVADVSIVVSSALDNKGGSITPEDQLDNGRQEDDDGDQVEDTPSVGGTQVDEIEDNDQNDKDVDDNSIKYESSHVVISSSILDDVEVKQPQENEVNIPNNKTSGDTFSVLGQPVAVPAKKQQIITTASVASPRAPVNSNISFGVVKKNPSKQVSKQITPTASPKALINSKVDSVVVEGTTLTKGDENVEEEDDDDYEEGNDDDEDDDDGSLIQQEHKEVKVVLPKETRQKVQLVALQKAVDKQMTPIASKQAKVRETPKNVEYTNRQESDDEEQPNPKESETSIGGGGIVVPQKKKKITNGTPVANTPSSNKSKKQSIEFSGNPMSNRSQTISVGDAKKSKFEGDNTPKVSEVSKMGKNARAKAEVKQKKKKATRDSSDDEQSESVSPVAKSKSSMANIEERERKDKERQQQMAEAARKLEEKAERLRQQERKKELINQELERVKEYMRNEELEAMKRRKFTLRQLKLDIESSITKIDRGVADSETNFQIDSYKMRIEQVNHFLEKIQTFVDTTIATRESCVEQVSEIFDPRHRWTRDRYKDKFMKYSKEIVIPEIPDNAAMPADIEDEEEIEAFLKFAMLSTDVDSILQRIKFFAGDSVFLIQFKEMLQRMKANVMQVGLDSSRKYERSEDDDKCDRIDEDGAVIKRFLLSKESDESMMQLNHNNSFKQFNPHVMHKLRALKSQDPSRFTELLNKSTNIRTEQSFLKAVAYTGLDHTKSLPKLPFFTKKANKF